MGFSFEDDAGKANMARSVEELVQVFLEAVRQHGYDRTDDIQRTRNCLPPRVQDFPH